MTSLPTSYFDKLYAEAPDPWRFETSDYERDKYQATLAALPQPAYTNALEIGCSIGVFTALLAARCTALLAIDPAAAALAQARERCRMLPHVSFAQIGVPDDWPNGCFDLVTLCEMVYYLDAAHVEKLAARLRDSVVGGGTIILVHYTDPTNYPLSGDEASDLLIDHARSYTERVMRARHPQYRLDVLRRI